MIAVLLAPDQPDQRARPSASPSWHANTPDAPVRAESPARRDPSRPVPLFERVQRREARHGKRGRLLERARSPAARPARPSGTAAISARRAGAHEPDHPRAGSRSVEPFEPPPLLSATTPARSQPMQRPASRRPARSAPRPGSAMTAATLTSASFRAGDRRLHVVDRPRAPARSDRQPLREFLPVVFPPVWFCVISCPSVPTHNQTCWFASRRGRIYTRGEVAEWSKAIAC